MSGERSAETKRPQHALASGRLRIVWWAFTIVTATISLAFTMVALFFLNEIRAGDGCPWTLDIDVVVERLEMAWLPGRVVCRSFNLETGVERVTTQRFTQLYFLPLSSLVPILSLVALRRSRAKA